MKAKNIASIFPILSVDADTHIIVSKNADITLAFELELPEIFAVSGPEYNAIHDVFLRAVKVLPVGYMVHKQDFFIEMAYAPDFTEGFLQHADFVARENAAHFVERPYLQHRCYIYLTLPASSPLKRNSLHSSLLKRHLVPKEMQSEKVWFDFVDTGNQFAAIFNDSSQLKLRKLTYAGIVGADSQRGILETYFSLSFQDQVLYDISTDEGLSVGGKHTFTYALTEVTDFPTDVYNQVRLEQFSSDKTAFPASTGSFFGLLLPFNHVYNQVLYIQDADALINQLVTEVKRHQSFMTWSKENSVASSAKDQFMEEIKAHNRRVVKSHYNLMVFHADTDTADKYRSETAAAISKLGFRPKLAQWDSETLFWSCIPGNVAEIGVDNLATMFADESVALWNMETNYKDEAYSKNGVLMTDRFGRPVMVDIFEGPMKTGLIANRNFMVVGPSGSGKSFTMNNIIYYLVSQGVHVTIVDVGHSYRRLCQQMGGRYITYEESNPISFNPFYFANLDPDEETMESLSSLLMGLWKKDDEKFSKAEETTITSMVFLYYRFMRNRRQERQSLFPCFDSFFDFVRDEFPRLFADMEGRDKEFDLMNFRFVLKKFYKGEQYGYLLNSRENVNLDEEPFVVYELDNIKDHAVLFPVTTIMIMNTYVRKLFNTKAKGTLKALVIEEAWKALSKDTFAGFLKWCSKTVRKHQGSLGVVTQEIDDLVGNEVIKDAIINNSPIKILLDQGNYASRFDEVMSTLSLSEKQASIILSINKGKDPNRPPYKELALILGDHTKVYGIEVSRSAYATFTTEKREVEEIKALQVSTYNGSMEKAIKGWAAGERVALG